MINHIEDELSEDVTTETQGGEAKITVAIGGFEVEVHGNDLEEAEESFFRVWEQTLGDAEEMSEALTGRLSEYH
jgi:Holliday junction resolvase